MDSSRETRRNGLIWVALVAVSAGSFGAGGSLGGTGIAALLLLAAALKFLLVGWQFMALRSAHWLWRLVLVALLAGFAGFAYWVSATVPIATL
jgi:hypothetical protein